MSTTNRVYIRKPIEGYGSRARKTTPEKQDSYTKGIFLSD